MGAIAAIYGLDKPRWHRLPGDRRFRVTCDGTDASPSILAPCHRCPRFRERRHLELARDWCKSIPPVPRSHLDGRNQAWKKVDAVRGDILIFVAESTENAVFVCAVFVFSV